MKKVLGSIDVDQHGDSFNINDNEYRTLQQIKDLFTETKGLHSQVILQTMSYQDLATIALQGRYVRDHQQNPSDHVHVDESMWEAVFPLLDAHFLQLIPAHLYEQFLDNVLSSLEVAGHYDANGKALMQYIILFFPKFKLIIYNY